MNPDLVVQVASYLAAAAASGVIGNVAYEPVTRLAAWFQRKEAPKRDGELSEIEQQHLREIFDEAKETWSPDRVEQHIHVQAGNDGIVINAAGSRINIGRRRRG